jgi:16S rRNA (guanine966-N2)-methyltransferase
MHALRIIGGVWRGRRLTFADIPGLRPTSDRIRETLFNWLQPHIEGSVCLDLFAGSGALGFEAASRGAAHVVMVESNSRAASHLQRQAAVLQAAQISVVNSDAFDWLRSNERIFDNVFLDPPFAKGLLGEATRLLRQGGVVTVGARIYMETEADLPAPELPDGWEYLRSKRAGRVRFYLAVVRII